MPDLVSRMRWGRSFATVPSDVRWISARSAWNSLFRLTSALTAWRESISPKNLGSWARSPFVTFSTSSTTTSKSGFPAASPFFKPSSRSTPAFLKFFCTSGVYSFARRSRTPLKAFSDVPVSLRTICNAAARSASFSIPFWPAFDHCAASSGRYCAMSLSSNCPFLAA
jgi:hypothetical protein